MDFLAVVAGWGCQTCQRVLFISPPRSAACRSLSVSVTPRVPALTLPRLEMKFFWAGTDFVLTGCGYTRKDAVTSCL